VDYRRIGATFRAIRIKKGWRQHDLGSRAGVSRAAISRVESGRIGGVSLDHLLLIATALDVAAGAWRALGTEAIWVGS
jgi:transcriptional regulator with XRE-family HTH domain